jgi:serine/threonine protein phosphatase PrpC
VLQAWGVSAKGSVRATNEDRFAIDEALQLCVVADGLGGHNAGEIAARTAVETLVEVVRDRDRIGWPFGIDPSLSVAGNLVRTAIHAANVQVVELASSSEACSGMGTTIVVALETQGRLTVGHVGDSRLYRLTGHRLCQLTGDDSWMASVMASDPTADASVLKHHPMRHMLTNVVGSRRGTEVHVVEEPLEAGDRLLMTTDGVHGILSQGQLERLLRMSADGSAVAAAIVRAALARGSQDNCTAVVAQYSANGCNTN